MIFRLLHKAGVPSDAFYAAAMGSIALSILAWAVRNKDDVANAERRGIFVGLWAPTFMMLGQGVHTLEVHEGYHSDGASKPAPAVDEVADNLRLTDEVASAS